MKPIEMGQNAMAWTRASMQWLDRWRDHADIRLGAVAGARLRTWLASVAAATVAGGLAAVFLHLILRAALRAGDSPGWLAVAATAAIALTLLVVVLRTTVVSLVAPQRRRTHLVGLLLSIAAILAGVQASAAATVALSGRSLDLWQAEQLYAWQAANSVPLLAIPERLEWSRPVIEAGDRPVLVAFTVAVVVPLVGAIVAVYHLTGSGLPWSAGGALVRRVAVPLVAAAGFLWGGLGPGTPLGDRIAAASGFAFAAAVAAVVLGGAAVGVLLAVVTGVLQRLWRPISDGPWMQLALAAGLVWIDTPIRRLLLPDGGDLAAPWKVIVMLGLWAVLTVLLLPVWVDPYLPETLLALMLLLAFATADGSGSPRVANLFGWTLAGFAVGPAVAVALACLTGAYLAYLVSRAPARAANDSGELSIGGSTDPRRDFLGSVYIGLQLVIAAAGTLLLLSGLGATSASAADAPRSLLAVAWHVADSVPGGLPAAAGWRLGADFTGRWSGAVIVATVGALVVFVVFPILRATVRWAKERAADSTARRPLADVPAELVADLAVVRAFLADEPGTADRAQRAEQRLSAARSGLGRLKVLMGNESPVYWAGEQAVTQAADAYRTVVKAQLSDRPLQWSMWPDRGNIADAIAAIDMYAAAAENWQMGPEVVAEIEYRLHDLASREDGVQQRESEATTREQAVDGRERGAVAREQLLRLQESATQAREEQVGVRERDAGAREAAVGAREHGADTREQAVGARERSVTMREADAEVREGEILASAQRNAEREQNVESRERVAASREQDIDQREHWVQAREQNAELRYEAIVAREREAADRVRPIPPLTLNPAPAVE